MTAVISSSHSRAWNIPVRCVQVPVVNHTLLPGTCYVEPFLESFRVTPVLQIVLPTIQSAIHVLHFWYVQFNQHEWFWMSCLCRFSLVNGILLPGGGANLSPGHPFYDTARLLVDLAVEANENGDYFPVGGRGEEGRIIQLDRFTYCTYATWPHTY